MVCDYIIDRLVKQNIFYGFGYLSKNINKLSYYANRNNKFSLIKNYNEESFAYSAITYTLINNKPGQLLNNSNDGFKNIEKPLYKNYINNKPIFLITLYRNEFYIKNNFIEKYIKKHIIFLMM